MNISGLMVILMILYLLYHFKDGSHIQDGGNPPYASIENKYQEPYYQQQYNELDNVDNVLNRPIQQGKDHIKDLHASNMYDHQELDLKIPPKKYLDFMDVQNRETPKDLKVLVEGKQHYFLDKALVIDYYGHKYYWDYRFPRQPISVEFARNPAQYIKEHPSVYPSYVIASRRTPYISP